ncbi:uncharacterized protein [Procambarus clarkii]|uniref:uncharacterized protein isoform X1 n=1 Tax=Procambarus clarkii TaxID=6728 RepID=UPI003743F985
MLMAALTVPVVIGPPLCPAHSIRDPCRDPVTSQPRMPPAQVVSCQHQVARLRGVDDGCDPASDGCDPASDGCDPASDGCDPASDGCDPASDGCDPASDGCDPASDGCDPASDGCDPASDGCDPASDGCDPASDGCDPASDGCDPASDGCDPASDGCDPPILKVAAGDVTYRGEGADHVVLRVINTGQVLRLRKTLVRGPVTSREELVLRAARDREVLRHVARRILGPLLTDESQLVTLNPDTLAALRRTVEPRRQGHRQHKEINKHGIASICPDAASIFINRRETSLPSSFSITTSSLSSLVTSSLPSSSVTSATSSFTASPMESLRTNVIMNLGESRISTSMSSKSGSFLRDDLNSRISSRVSVVESCDYDENTSASKPTLETRNMLAVASSTSVSELKNVCIEIKPKQGFLDYSTPDLPLCRYCVKQFLKRRKDHHSRSSYCPLDLYSGDVERMRRAVDGLIQSPQNNFKVFQDGEPVEDCRPFSYLRDVIITALTFNFSSGNARVPKHSGPLSARSPLGRILAFQTLDDLGVFRARRLYQGLVSRVGTMQDADILLQDLGRWTDDSASLYLQCGRHKHKHHCGNTCHTRKRKHHLLSNGLIKPVINADSSVNVDQQSIADIITRDGDIHLANVDGMKVSTCTENGRLESGSSDHLAVDGSEDEEEASEEETVRKLQNYLLSTTAKDLSLMILLSGPHTSSLPHCTTANTSPFTIVLEDGVWFKCQVTGVDLVAKPPSKILKHEQDYQRLKEVLLELRNRGFHAGAAYSRMGFTKDVYSTWTCR